MTPYFSFVLTERPPFFYYLVFHKKTSTLGVLSAHPRHFHMWVPPMPWCVFMLHESLPGCTIATDLLYLHHPLPRLCGSTLYSNWGQHIGHYFNLCDVSIPGITIMLKVQLATLLAASMNVYVTCVAPTGNSDPGTALGNSIRWITSSPESSFAVGCVQVTTAESSFMVATVVMSSGQPNISGGVISGSDEKSKKKYKICWK